jgi:hypothetical protein
MGSRPPCVDFSYPGYSAHAALASIFIILAASTSLAGRPALTVSVSPPVITNQGEEATFTITASSPPTRNLKVNFFLAGSALINRDYVLLKPIPTPAIIQPPQIIFPAGQSSIEVILHAMGDDQPFGQLFATFFLEPGRRYRVGHPLRASLTIENIR